MKRLPLLCFVAILALDDGCTKTSVSAQPAASATTSMDGKQVFEIIVKDGYQPREITAKAGVPVILKMKTQGTFDCSNVFTVPKLGIRTQLQPTGEASIEIPAQKAGDSVYGVCGMGMLTLVIKFT